MLHQSNSLFQAPESKENSVGRGTSTSLGRKGLKKQSSSLRRLMVRLQLVEAITSFTEDRTKEMDSCREQAPGSHGWQPQCPAALPGSGIPMASLTSKKLTKRALKCSS